MKQLIMTSFTALSFLLLLTIYFPHAQGKQVPPNIIFILVDDLGAADVSFSARRLNDGYARIKTPNIDRIAAENGVELSKFYTHHICGPSRSSLITGRYAHRMGNPFAMVKGGGLDKKYGTLSSEFKARGYRTHFIGKWGIDFPRPSEEVLKRGITPELFNGYEKGIGPTERGYDTFYGLYNSGHNHYTKEVLYSGMVDWHNHNETHKLDYPDVDPKPKEYSTHLFTKEAIRIINGWSKFNSYYLHVSYTAPHDPLQAPESYLEYSSCRDIKNWRRKTFCAMVMVIDEGVGEILNTLEANGLASNTIIAFSTDNGGAPTVGGMNYPFRGQKATAYEGGIHNPGILKVPKELADRRAPVYSNLMHIADFAPTLLSLVDRYDTKQKGHSILGNDIDGVDHADHMYNFGNIPKSSPRDKVVAEYNIFMDNAVIIAGNGKYKLILGNAGRDFRYLEPTGVSYDENRRVGSLIEEFICDKIDGLGPNWFLIGWVFRYIIDKIINGRAIDRKIVGKYAWEALTHDFGYRLHVSNDTLPNLDWQYYEHSRIQLFDLENDPYEDKNIALQNKEMVSSLYEELVTFLRTSEDQHISVQKQLLSTILTFLVVILAVAILGVGFLIYKIWSICLRELYSRKIKAD